MIPASDKAKERSRKNAELDGLVKRLVLARDGNACVRCGKKILLQAAHILPKGRYPRLRFETLNILTLCVYDHLFWAHKNPIEFTQWLEEKYPGRIQTLQEMAATARKVDMKELLIGLKLEVKALDDLPPGKLTVYEPIKDSEIPF
jgi:hypothetical protein